ncbi:MAG: hypothetical protein JXA15_13700 [Spirochaetales bacterium]|nr:hypothetical protein [Spirochaetales bacterium]
MKSLYDELSEKAAAEGATKRVGARADLGMLLYGRREALRELYVAAEAVVRAGSVEAERERLAGAVTALAPLFGER